MLRIVPCRSCLHRIDDDSLLNRMGCDFEMDMDKAVYFKDCPEFIEEVKLCPICDRAPQIEMYSKDIRYRCPGCGDNSGFCITRAQAAENWNAGITDEYVKEVKEAYE